ncbi:beta-2 adrenergic receptor-like [Biomphalaria glabrata]|uniref:Beta-2 adrenergic receptor-like n=1 Tax=Biomphalaria glabrata TaxID=6526 RepID=A0A9W2Z5Q6_BIOGL|nr:beta-2 adrenergic receptor-like [Biomphalaria glabrata]XP_055870319.1 beta-2 adrenergic receptor-like [Biomphalaria glabrata]
MSGPNSTLEQGIASDTDLNNYGVALSILSGVICSFGALANAVNVVVFFKQGLTDTVTVTFFALSVIDVGVTLTMLGVGLCFSPLITGAGYPVNTFDLSYIIGWTHIAFSRVSSGMTAFVSFERCLCIATPLKVKTIITLRRTCVILVVITIIMTLSTVPVFYTSRMAWVSDPVSNTTVLKMVYTDDRSFVDGISFGINTVFLVPGIFVATIIFAVILTFHLSRKAKWRDSVANSKGRPETGSKDKALLSNKDRKAIKMVAIISVVFIVCYAPDITTVMTAIVVPEFNVGKREQNLLFITGTFTLLMQSINSSVSIFIYFNMSSKFKKTFYEIYLGKCRKLTD